MNVVEDLIKQIEVITSIACENADNDCGICPYYSSVRGCMLDSVRYGLEYIEHK